MTQRRRRRRIPTLRHAPGYAGHVKIAKNWSLENNFPHLGDLVLKSNSHIAISLIAVYLFAIASAMSEIFLYLFGNM